MLQQETPNALSIDIVFQNVECTFKQFQGYRTQKKRVLHGVSGSFKSGELTAVMGPSGSGKTTLLNILTGFQKNFDGNVSYHSDSSQLSWKAFTKYSRYIQQEDALHAFFSVHETMSFAAELKLDRNLSRKSKQKIMDEILSSLDLIKTKDTLCGNLSGGQRKRFSIALELINNPLVIFLDEPTTGLDIVAAMQCATVLKNLAKKNRTIVCTIHQPSTAIYELFDHVYLVADGCSVYQGDPMKIVDFFSSVGLTCPMYHNPSDYAMEVISKEYGDFNKRLASAQDLSWRKTVEPVKNVKTVEQERKKSFSIMNSPSELNKAGILFKYCLFRYYRDWFGTLLKFIIYTTAPVLVGLTYFDAGMNAMKAPMNIGMIVLVALVLFYCSIMPAVLKFPFEVSILRKESLNGWYKIRTYYICFLLIHLVMQLILITLFLSILYIMSNQPHEWRRFIMFEVMIVLICFIGEAIGMNLGIIFHPLAGTFGATAVGMLNIPFCGYFILFSHMTPFMYNVSKIMFSSYCMEGLLHAIYGFDRKKLDCPSDQDICFYRYPKVLMIAIGLHEQKYAQDTLVLLGHIIFLFTSAYFLLKRKVSSV